MMRGTIAGMRPALWWSIALLVVVNVGVLCALPQKQELSVIFLDVGQGDAILVEGPTGRQMLIDGGRDRSVLRELGKQLGPLDRSLDLVVETHPDADHIGGLAGVLKSYAVSSFMSPGVVHDGSVVAALHAAAEAEAGMETVTARRGMRILLGGGAYADVLYPDRDVPNIETNTGSIVLRVVYGDTSFFLSGDAPEAVEEWVVRLDGGAIESDVLKAGHHGSRTSTGTVLLAAARPEVVVVSAGKDNPYGHPHQEVLERVAGAGAVVLSTIEEGAVRFVSDGEKVRQK